MGFFVGAGGEVCFVGGGRDGGFYVFDRFFEFRVVRFLLFVGDVQVFFCDFLEYFFC